MLVREPSSQITKSHYHLYDADFFIYQLFCYFFERPLISCLVLQAVPNSEANSRRKLEKHEV